MANVRLVIHVVTAAPTNSASGQPFCFLGLAFTLLYRFVYNSARAHQKESSRSTAMWLCFYETQNCGWISLAKLAMQRITKLSTISGIRLFSFRAGKAFFSAAANTGAARSGDDASVCVCRSANPEMAQTTSRTLLVLSIGIHCLQA